MRHQPASARSCVVPLAAIVTLLLRGALAPAQEPDSTALPRVVVTATREPVAIAGDALAATVLHHQDLARLGVRDVADALRLVPGLAVVRTGGAGAQSSLFLRGGESDFTRVLVDGVPVNDAGGAIDLSWLSLANVDRIEVVRGPASVLYGSDAVAGVVQIFTRDGSGGPAWTVAAESGRFGSTRGDATLGIGGAWGSLSFGAARERSEGMLPFNNAFRQDGLSARARVGIATGGTLAAAARHGRDEYHYPTDGAGRVVDRNAFRRDRRTLVSAELSQPVGSRARAVIALSALEGRLRTDDAPDSPDDSVGFYAYESSATSRRRVADTRLSVSLAGASLLTVGAEWMREAVRSADSSNFSTVRSAFRAERFNRAYYVQWLAEPGRLSFSAGARYDDNDVFGVFRTARVAAAFRPWAGGILRASAGGAFKAPTFLESFSSAFSVGNPDLVPERSRSWELGVRQALAGGRAQVAVTWFDQRFRDLIQYTFVSPELPNYFNVAAASARGMEVEASGALTTVLRATVAATLLRTRVDDAGFDTGEGATFVQGQRLLRRPARGATLTLSATPGARTTADLVIRHVGARHDRDFATFPTEPVVLDAYTRTDVSVSHLLVTGDAGVGARLFARLENLLGERYEEVTNFGMPGRVLTVGLRLSSAR
ncbi:MAG TPA: TonB-dependent receptor [Gemmatimonadaceae bacterium]|nr:TonB-dependent receptor [Gemmatimonadaceae bacterium]